MRSHSPCLDQVEQSLFSSRQTSLSPSSWHSLWIDCVDEFVEFSDSCTPELVLGLAAQLGAMLRGGGGDSLPTLNAWGFSMDDAMVLAALRNLEAAAPDGATIDDWAPPAREYLEKVASGEEPPPTLENALAAREAAAEPASA